MDKQPTTGDPKSEGSYESKTPITSNESNRYPNLSVIRPFDNLLMLDFETTASGDGDFDFPSEITQWGVTVLYGPGPDWQIKPNTDFNEFVRPMVYPTLSPYVIGLTGVTQENVDNAEQFPEVYKKFCDWLDTTGIANSNFAIVTDGRQDMWRHAQYEFLLHKMTMPVFFKRFVSAFHVFQSHISEESRFSSAVGKKTKTQKRNEQRRAQLERRKALEEMEQNPNEQEQNQEEQEQNQEPEKEDAETDKNLADVGKLTKTQKRNAKKRAQLKREKAKETEQSKEEENMDVEMAKQQEPLKMDGLEGLKKEEGCGAKRNMEEGAEEKEQGCAESQRKEEVKPTNPDVQKVAEEDEEDLVAGQVFPDKAECVEEGPSEPSAKKSKLDGTPFIQQMCEHYGIERHGRMHNALDDAKALRDVVRKMLKEKKAFFFNYAFTCSCSMRNEKLNLKDGWRLDWQSAMKVYEAVLPFYAKGVSLQKIEEAATCKFCKKPIEVCGIDGVHMQFPSYLFESEDVTFGPIKFAVRVGLDVQKPTESPSTEGLSVDMAEKL